MNRYILIIGIILVLIRFAPSLFSDKALVFGDNYSLLVPGKLYSSYWLKQGIIPWWNPTIFAGIPWAHDVSQTFFYPSTLLFAFLHPGIALNLTVGIHLLFMFIGMYLAVLKWTKNKNSSLVGAILWTFSTQVTASINNLNTIQSIAWFPWVLLFSFNLHTARQRLYFSIVVLGQFLAGYPQHVVYSILFAVLFQAINKFDLIAWKKWLGDWMVTAVITLFVTAFAWVPFIEPFFQSTRMEQTLEQAANGSLQPAMLIKVLFPYFFDNPVSGFKWGPAWSGFPNSVFYISWFGFFGVILLIIRKANYNKGLLFIALFGVVFSLGSFLPGYTHIQTLIPFFRVGRYPSMMLLWTNLAFILLVCQRFEQIISYSRRIRIAPLAVVSVICFFVYIFLGSFYSSLWESVDVVTGNKLSLSTFHTLERDFIIIRNILFYFCVSLLLNTAALVLIRYKRITLFIGLLGLDMIINTQNMLFFAPRSVYPSWFDIHQTISKLPLELKDHNYRTLTRNMNEPYTDFGMYWEALAVRAPFSDSFIDKNELEEYSILKDLRLNYTPDWNMVYQIPVIHGYTTLLPKDFSVIWEEDKEPGINAIDNVDLNSIETQQWSVRNYVVDKNFVISENLPASPQAISASVDLYQLPALSRFRYADGSPIAVLSHKENPNTIFLSIDNGQDKQSLLIADRYDKNWRVTINGQHASIQNYQEMRLISIPEGKSEIILSYFPFSWLIGITISLTSILLIVIFSTVRVIIPVGYTKRV